MMSLATLEEIVKRAFAEATDFISFGFQGGEPMLAGLDFYRAFVEFEKQYNLKGIPAVNTIQTNGTLVDARWAEFFAQNQFLVGLSIDGGKDVHNKLRPDAQGGDTHNRCLKAAAMLTKAGVEFNILTVITKDLALHPDTSYQFYKKNGFRYLQLIPCLDGLGEPHGANPYSLDALLYGQFLCRFFDLWYADFISGDYYSVRMFDNYVRMIMGEQPENCGMLGHCNPYPVIEADGSVYPCDFYVVDEYLLGNIQQDSFEHMLSSDTAMRFAQPSIQVNEACRGCQYGFLCRGGCRRDREPMAGDALSLNNYCEGYKLFFGHALPRMADIARKMTR